MRKMPKKTPSNKPVTVFHCLSLASLPVTSVLVVLALSSFVEFDYTGLVGWLVILVIFTIVVSNGTESKSLKNVFKLFNAVSFKTKTSN